MNNLVKECSQGDVWPIKAWTWRASRRPSEDLVILHFIFDGDSHRGRPVQHYEDEPRLCLFGLSLTIPPWMSSANTIQEDHEEHHCCRKKGDIANIRHHSHCHNRRWYTSFKSVPFFAQRTRNFGLFWLFCCKFA